MDGPDQFKIKGKVNNITIADYEMMPMNADVLSFENFLTPEQSSCSMEGQLMQGSSNQIFVETGNT